MSKQLTELRELMGGSIPTEVSRALRAVAKLDEAIIELGKVGIRMQISQLTAYDAHGNNGRHGGFELTLRGKQFYVANVRVPEPTPK